MVTRRHHEVGIPPTVVYSTTFDVFDDTLFELCEEYNVAYEDVLAEMLNDIILLEPVGLQELFYDVLGDANPPHVFHTWMVDNSDVMLDRLNGLLKYIGDGCVDGLWISVHLSVNGRYVSVWLHDHERCESVEVKHGQNNRDNRLRPRYS